jgi:hypothetical protein
MKVHRNFADRPLLAQSGRWYGREPVAALGTNPQITAGCFTLF